MKNKGINSFRSLMIVESLSAIFGIIGITMGILSILALKPDIWKKPEIEGEFDSFIFTSVTVCFDFLSTFFAGTAWYIGEQLVKDKKEKGIEVSKVESIANKMDLSSFFFGFFGWILSILSLLFLFPFLKNDLASEATTIVSIILDTISAGLVITVIIILTRHEYKSNN